MFESAKQNGEIKSVLSSYTVIKSLDEENCQPDTVPDSHRAADLWSQIFGNDTLSEYVEEKQEDGTYNVSGYIKIPEYGFKISTSYGTHWYTIDESSVVKLVNGYGTVDLMKPGSVTNYSNNTYLQYVYVENGVETIKQIGTKTTHEHISRYIKLNNLIAMIDVGVIFAKTKNGLTVLLSKNGGKYVIYDNTFHNIRFAVDVSGNYDKLSGCSIMSPLILCKDSYSFIEVGDFIENLYIGPADPVKEKRNFSVGSDSFRWIFNNYYVRYA